MSTDQLHLAIVAERSVIRNDQPTETDLAIDLITSKTLGARSSYAINLCVVIDRSGSMNGDKLDQAKNGCVAIFDSLGQNDRFSVLAFDDNVISVVNPQTPRAQVSERIRTLQSGGQTNLSKGWYFGLLELQTYTTDQHINRLILLSDGQANAGEQKPLVLGAESGRARDELGITSSTIGIGEGFQEDILAAIAHESGGRFWYIGEARIEDIIKEEFSGALSVFLERPRIQVDLPDGTTIARELNDLPKFNNRYRLRPIKANDQFSFALRLRVEPANIAGDNLPISATLLDGAGVVERAETVLRLGSLEEYVQSPEDPRVAMIVSKYLAAASDERIVEQMDKGNVTTMINMLRSQSDLMKELEAKLAGASLTSWEEESTRELARLRMAIEENGALMAIGQLVDLIQGLGRNELANRLATNLMGSARKVHRHRGARDMNWDPRGGDEDSTARDLLSSALAVAQELTEEYPSLKEEITAISKRLNEQLARFS